MNSILAFLQNQQFAVLAALVVPFIFKYFPAFKKLSNELCTLLAALSAWAANVFVGQAHAAFLGGALGGFASVFIPLIDALITKLLHDNVFNPAYKALGVKKPK